MFSPAEYELVDFGYGRKLERFAARWCDRPCPAAADATPSSPQLWEQVDYRFEGATGGEGKWTIESNDQAWQIRNQTHDQEVAFFLKPTPAGHLGIFPEQATNWDWISKRVSLSKNKPKVLNLFAYTGGSTMAAAAAGASEVVHVDASKPVVQWARQNAEQAGLGDARIRWIVEDATKFVQRELKRGNHYDAVILDPPSYGHGPKGQPWKLESHLHPLLELCRELTAGSLQFFLLTAHSPGFGPAELEATLADAVFGSCAAGARSRPLELVCRDGRRLNAGVAARWP